MTTYASEHARRQSACASNHEAMKKRTPQDHRNIFGWRRTTLDIAAECLAQCIASRSHRSLAGVRTEADKKAGLTASWEIAIRSRPRRARPGARPGGWSLDPAAQGFPARRTHFPGEKKSSSLSKTCMWHTCWITWVCGKHCSRASFG